MADRRHRVVIVGGGFGGLYAAMSMKKLPLDITLIDKRNFHLFQPLLYQVATGGLSPGDIASPIRAVLRKNKNITCVMGEAVGIDPGRRAVQLRRGEVEYDTLIVATGASHSYFGNDHWAKHAPGLKTVEDAIEIRHRILNAFESAERETDPEAQAAWLTFVIAGAGPTGVEMAGAMAELANDTLRGDFRHTKPEDARIVLLEGRDRVLPTYPADLSQNAQWSLEYLGVDVRTNSLVTDVNENGVTVKTNGGPEFIPAKTVVWAAGVKSSPLGAMLRDHTGCELDRIGRVVVNPDLSVPGHPEIFVIGDLAHCKNANGEPLPGVAPVAMQQGRYMANLLKKRLRGESGPPFHYKDHGMMAVIGRAAAVADLRVVKLTGFPAWLAWLLIHLINLVEYENRLLVLIQWGINYFTFNRGARLITGEIPPGHRYESRGSGGA